VLVQLLNVSVDPPDFAAIDRPEDLSYNDLESIVEIVIEEALGYEDALPEYDDNDSDQDGRANPTPPLDNFPPPRVALENLTPTDDHRPRGNFRSRSLTLQHFREVFSPPPEA
jgi:hypothetical protein